MKVDVERLEDNRVELTIEVPRERVESAVDKAYRKTVKQINIPGFRKGKAPRRIVERFVGREVLLDEAIDALLPEVYMEAVEKAGVEPIDTPHVDLDGIDGDGPLKVTAKVEVKPEVQLGDISQIKVEKEKPEVTQEMIDSELNRLRESQAELVNVDGPVEEGHHVTIDFNGFLDGEPLEGASAEGYTLEIGSKTFVPGFEEQLVGAEKGETREITVKFPEDYQQESLRSKEVRFEVTIKEIKKKELPELDDELAKSLGDFQNLQELKDKITNTLTEMEERRVQRKLESEAVNALVEASSVEIPDKLVKRRIDDYIKELEGNLQRQGKSLEDYYEETGKTREDVEKDLAEDARKSVKRELVLQALAKREGIKAGDEDLQEEIRRMALMYGQKPEVISQLLSARGGLAELKDQIIVRKAVELLGRKVTEAQAKETDEEGDIK